MINKVIEHTAEEQQIKVPTSSGTFEGSLVLPEGAEGLVIVVDGGGSNRLSPRNKLMAQAIEEKGLGTLLLDLLTSDEKVFDARKKDFRIDETLISERVAEATDWLKQQSKFENLRIGYLGIDTGGAPALEAASKRTNLVDAVISIGGDLNKVISDLSKIRSATLLVTGDRESELVERHKQAFEKVEADKDIKIIENQGPFLEEQTDLGQIKEIIQQWFQKHLTSM